MAKRTAIFELQRNPMALTAPAKEISRTSSDTVYIGVIQRTHHNCTSSAASTLSPRGRVASRTESPNQLPYRTNAPRRDGGDGGPGPVPLSPSLLCIVIFIPRERGDRSGAVLEDSTVAAADVAGGGHLLLGQHRGGGARWRRAWSEWRVRPSVHSSSFRRLYDALRCPAQPESARDAEGLARLLVNGNFLPSTQPRTRKSHF